MNPNKSAYDYIESTTKFDECCIAYSVKYWYCKGIENGCNFESDVYGSDPYTINTGLCKAGLHKGVINEYGGIMKQIIIGFFFFYFSYNLFILGRKTNFVGLTKNGLTSLEYPQPSDAMTIEVSDIPFPIYNEMSCGYIEIFSCVGLENKCNYLKVETPVYGSNPYSSDSNLCKAALHSGLIGPKGGFCLKYPLGQVRSFRGTINNSIPTLTYLNYFEGFKMIPLTDDLNEYVKKYCSLDRCGKNNQKAAFFCLGKNNGCIDEYTVWGSNPYTYDSSSCLSAYHSGVIDKNGGIYWVDGYKYYSEYIGSQKNDIKSQDWKQLYEGMIISKF